MTDSKTTLLQRLLATPRTEYLRQPSSASLLTGVLSDDEEPLTPKEHVVSPKSTAQVTPALSNLLPTLVDLLQEMKSVAESHRGCRLFVKRGLSKGEYHKVLRQEFFLFRSIITNKLSTSSLLSRVRRAVRGFWFQSELRITLQSFTYMSEAARSARGIYELLRVEITSLHSLKQRGELPSSNCADVSEQIRVYIYSIIVLMTMVAFPANVCATLLFDESTRSRDALVLAKVLRQHMPPNFQEATGGWLSKSKNIPRSSKEIADGFPVHPSWVENGSPLGFLGLNYAWYIGLGELNAEYLRQNKKDAINEMLDIENILSTSIRHFLSDAIAELHQELTDVNFLSTGLVVLVFAVPTYLLILCLFLYIS